MVHSGSFYQELPNLLAWDTFPASCSVFTVDLERTFRQKHNSTSHFFACQQLSGAYDWIRTSDITVLQAVAFDHSATYA